MYFAYEIASVERTDDEHGQDKKNRPLCLRETKKVDRIVPSPSVTPVVFPSRHMPKCDTIMNYINAVLKAKEHNGVKEMHIEMYIRIESGRFDGFESSLRSLYSPAL